MRSPSLFSMAFCACVLFANSAMAQSPVQAGSAAVGPAITQGEAGPAAAYAWAGLWFSNHYLGGYIGGIKALNETDDLWSDGWALRFDASGGSYRYDSIGFHDVRVGTLISDVMIGYRKKIDKGMLSVYAGPSYAFHQNPDPLADIRGTEWGAKFLGEYSGPLGERLQGYAQASYTTSFDTYSLAGRMLYRATDGFWIGPQATLYGNNAPYSESTFGPAAKFDTTFGEVGLAAGYRHVWTSGHPDGYFAEVYLGFPIE